MGKDSYLLPRYCPVPPLVGCISDVAMMKYWRWDWEFGELIKVGGTFCSRSDSSCCQRSADPAIAVAFTIKVRLLSHFPIQFALVLPVSLISDHRESSLPRGLTESPKDLELRVPFFKIFN